MPRDFASVYDEHVRRVYGFFGYLLSSRADAEDLTQQTFERAFRSWERYDESRGEASTWLMVIARNLFVDHMRASRAVRLAPVDDLHLEGTPATPDRHSLGLDPDLERALGELGPREHELIALRFGGDLTAAEIAALTGLTLANVQQILSRTLRRLRECLDGTPAAAGRAGVH
jgi:RNA polymerase sigma-70 factor, ECF subfamily